MAESVISQEESVILSMFHGLWLNRCLSLVVSFKIPDLLCTTEKPSLSIQEIAEKTGCSTSDRIYVIMRLMAQWGIGKELENQHFAKNKAMELLRLDQEPSLGHIINYCCCDEYLVSLQHLPEAVRTNKSAFSLAHEMKDIFEYMNQIDESPYDKSKQFRGSSPNMVGSDDRRRELVDYHIKSQAKHTQDLLLADFKSIPTVYTVYPWSSCNSLLDAGGSTGSFLASILKQPDCQHIQGFVADLPDVIDHARHDYHQLGLPENRITFLKQDLTEPFPKGFQVDVIILKKTIVVFDTEQQIKVLRNCRSILPKEGGKVVIITFCLAEAGALNQNIGINGLQLGVTALHVDSFFQGGSFKPKSEAEKFYKKIGNQAGFKLSNIYDTFLGGNTMFELSTM